MRVVVVAVIHERLAEGRRAVETCDAKRFELGHSFEPCDPEQVEACLGARIRSICQEAGEDICGFKRHHATEGDAV